MMSRTAFLVSVLIIQFSLLNAKPPGTLTDNAPHTTAEPVKPGTAAKQQQESPHAADASKVKEEIKPQVHEVKETVHEEVKKEHVQPPPNPPQPNVEAQHPPIDPAGKKVTETEDKHIEVQKHEDVQPQKPHVDAH